jgi:hypothetical protein
MKAIRKIKMIQAIKLFLLKRRIGYKPYERGVNNYCCTCIAYENSYYALNGYCDRYKFTIKNYYTCSHFVPETPYPLSEKDRAELEKTKNYLWDTFKGMIDNFGGRK